MKRTRTKINLILHRLSKILHKEGRPVGDFEYADGRAGKLTIGYWVVGKLLEEPSVGKRLKMYRLIRNGESAEGLFETSRIVKIQKPFLFTENSMYEMKEEV
jgi:hypothetical protein